MSIIEHHTIIITSLYTVDHYNLSFATENCVCPVYALFTNSKCPVWSTMHFTTLACTRRIKTTFHMIRETVSVPYMLYSQIVNVHYEAQYNFTTLVRTQ